MSHGYNCTGTATNEVVPVYLITVRPRAVQLYCIVLKLIADCAVIGDGAFTRGLCGSSRFVFPRSDSERPAIAV